MTIDELCVARKCRRGSSARILLVAVGCFVFQMAGSVVVAENAENVRRFMQEGILVSLEEPSLAIAVEDSFTFVGRHPITIRDVGAGERFVFVDAEHESIRRLFIVQFEGFLPGVDDFFWYDLSGSPVVANYPFRSNGYAFDIAESIAANPTGESAATQAFLGSNAYSVPDQWMMWRSLTVADKARKREVILFYVEDVESSGLTLTDLYTDDSATQAWINTQRNLEVRANNSFQLAELDENGDPVASTWSSIPNTFMQ